jgi:hypothetical protein
MDNEIQDARGFQPGAVIAGAVLLALGTAMLLNSTGAVDIRVGRLVGPLWLIAIGASMVLGRSMVVFGHREVTADGKGRRHLRRRGSAASGIWLIGLGVWMMASQTHLFGLTFATSWPLLLILSGLMIVIRGIR